MSTTTVNTVNASEIPAVPFFARFLEEQTPPETDDYTTLKYPSDWEDY